MIAPQPTATRCQPVRCDLHCACASVHEYDRPACMYSTSMGPASQSWLLGKQKTSPCLIACRSAGDRVRAVCERRKRRRRGEPGPGRPGRAARCAPHLRQARRGTQQRRTYTYQGHRLRRPSLIMQGRHPFRRFWGGLVYADTRRFILPIM